MQKTPNPLALLLRQLTNLGATAVMQQQRATAFGQRQPHAPALSFVVTLTLPAATVTRPVAAPCPANDNAEG